MEGKSLHPILINIGSIHLPTYGVLLVLAIMGGIYTTIRLGRSVGFDSGRILDFCTWVILVALVGAKRGRMAEIADQAIVINDTHYGRVEDAQMGICHMLCYAFMENPQWAK